MDVLNAGDGEFDGLRIEVSRLCVPGKWNESPFWRTSLERIRERFVEAARKSGRLACLLKNDTVGTCETVEAFYPDGRRVKCVQPESADEPPHSPRFDPHELCGLPMVASESQILRHPRTSDGSFDPGVRRNYKIHGDRERWQEYSAIAEAAGSCLPGLPAHVTTFVWRDWLNGFDKQPDDTLWTYAVFELAWRRIPGSSLKAERFADVKGCRIPLDDIPSLRADANQNDSSDPPEVTGELANLPDDPPHWYSLLDDLLNASITAIDLMFAIADQATEQVATPIPHQQASEATVDDSSKSDAGAGRNNAQERFSWKVDGDSFVIRFDGEQGKFLKQWVGFRRYRQLLQSPDGRVSMAELYGSKSDQRVSNDLDRSKDWSVDENGLKVIDQQREELIAEQDEARMSGDLDKVDECEEKIKTIDEWLKKNTRLKKKPGGKHRRVAKNISDPFAKMRSTIWDSFTEARERMIGGKMPKLAEHLQPDIGIVSSEGGDFTYSQSAAVPWVFE